MNQSFVLLLLASPFILILFLIAFLTSEGIQEKFFGVCPECGEHSVRTITEDTGRDSSYPETRHTYVFKKCRSCGWQEGKDINHRPDLN